MSTLTSGPLAGLLARLFAAADRNNPAAFGDRIEISPRG
jgi:hypothetical protein